MTTLTYTRTHPDVVDTYEIIRQSETVAGSTLFTVFVHYRQHTPHRWEWVSSVSRPENLPNRWECYRCHQTSPAKTGRGNLPRGHCGDANQVKTDEVSTYETDNQAEADAYVEGLATKLDHSGFERES